MIPPITARDSVAGQNRVPGGIDNVRRHQPGQIGVQPNGSRSARRSLACTRGSARWLNRPGRGRGPGACLPTGCTPAASRPAATARPSRATVAGSAAKARSPTTLLAPGSPGPAPARRPRRSRRQRSPGRSARRSGTRRAARRRGCAAKHRPSAAAGGCARQCGGRRRATRPPSWSTISTASRGRTRRSDAIERRQLRRVEDVAREQDHAGRGVGAEQRRFVGQQGWAGDADDGGLHGGSIARHTPESLPPDAAAPAVFENRRRHRLAERVPVNAGAAASPLNEQSRASARNSATDAGALAPAPRRESLSVLLRGSSRSPG